MICADESKAEHLRMAGFAPVEDFEAIEAEQAPHEAEPPAIGTEKEPHKRGRPRGKRG